MSFSDPSERYKPYLQTVDITKAINNDKKSAALRWAVDAYKSDENLLIGKKVSFNMLATLTPPGAVGALIDFAMNSGIDSKQNDLTKSLNPTTSDLHFTNGVSEVWVNVVTAAGGSAPMAELRNIIKKKFFTASRFHSIPFDYLVNATRLLMYNRFGRSFAVPFICNKLLPRSKSVRLTERSLPFYATLQKGGSANAPKKKSKKSKTGKSDRKKYSSKKRGFKKRRH